MELDEEAKYRLSYLTLRLFLDRLLTTKGVDEYPKVLAFLDLLAGTQMAGEASGKRYASQREKIESFIDAEFDEEILRLVSGAIDELV